MNFVEVFFLPAYIKFPQIPIEQVLVLPNDFKSMFLLQDPIMTFRTVNLLRTPPLILCREFLEKKNNNNNNNKKLLSYVLNTSKK